MKPIKNHISFIRRTFLFTILLLPNLYALLQVSDLTYSPTKSAAYAAVTAVCLLIPALLLKAKAYFIFEGVLSLFCAPIEIASIYLNKATASTTFLGLIYHTNPVEVSGIISAFWYLALLTAGIWIAYFVAACREKQEYLLPPSLKKTLLIAVPVICVAGMTIFTYLEYRIDTGSSLTQKTYTAFRKATMKFNKIFPYDFYLNSLKLWQNNRETQALIRQSEDFSFGITASEDSTPLIAVVVIGEAARSANFSLNGHERCTNPKLGRRANIVSYPNAYTQANTTEMSVPHMYSRIGVENAGDLYKEKNLADAFGEAGYYRIWITNKAIRTYTDRIIRRCDYCHIAGKGELSTVNNLDMQLLPALQEAVRVTDKPKQFITLHTMGSHWRYDIRYTSEYEVFEPATDKRLNAANISAEARDRLVNAYDNSLLYTDAFLDSLIYVLDSLDKPAIMLYLSDHGENLYDDERGLVLHGSYEGTRYEFNIPFIIWYSDEYAALHPAKTEELQAHRDTQFNSSAVFHTMLDAAGISEATDLTKSLCSECFLPMDTMYAMTADESVVRITKDNIIR